MLIELGLSQGIINTYFNTNEVYIGIKGVKQ